MTAARWIWPLERNGKDAAVTVAPTRGAAGCHLGVSVRDSMAGIGTVTYYDPATGGYGALGHGVNDLQSLVLLPVESGEILPSSVVEVRKGVRGTPGLLKGAFDTSTTLGTVERNTDHGIFGQCSGQLGGIALPVATAEEIQTGKATDFVQCDRIPMWWSTPWRSHAWTPPTGPAAIWC